MNEYTLTDAFDFTNEIRNLSINEDDILVTYDVAPLFTDVPSEETICILANKDFNDDDSTKRMASTFERISS